MKKLLTVAFVLLITIANAQMDSIYCFTPDNGVQFLTCPNINLGNVTLQSRYLSYDTNAFKQQWKLKDNKLECILNSGVKYFIKESCGNNCQVQVTTDRTQSADVFWGGYDKPIKVISKNAPLDSMCLTVSGGLLVYSNLLTPTNWSILFPIPALKTDTWYYLLSSNSKALRNSNVNSGQATLGSIYDSLAFFMISGTYNNGVITNATIKSKNKIGARFLIGMQGDIPVQSFNAQNLNYSWTVVDNGDGTASFQSLEGAISKGYMDAVASPVLQFTRVQGRNSQKWKFTKSGGNR